MQPLVCAQWEECPQLAPGQEELRRVIYAPWVQLCLVTGEISAVISVMINVDNNRAVSIHHPFTGGF